MKFYTNVAQVKGKLLVRGYDHDGNQVKETVNYKPYYFIENQGQGDYKTLDGRPVMKVDMKSIFDIKDYYKRKADISNGNEIFGYDQYAYTYINEKFKGEVEYDASLIRVANIDIETASDKGMPDVELASDPITAITIKFGEYILSLGCDDYEPSEPDVTYIKCNDETDLLNRFLEAWEYFAPDVVTGWYIENFDIPYIVNRIKLILGEGSANRLSPWGHLREKNVIDNRGVMKRLYFPTGIALLDYIKIYKKMELAPRESYKLDFIASVEVGAKKLDYSEYENLYSLYKENFQKFMDYNVRDVRLVDMIDQKKKLLDLTYLMAYKSHCNFEDVNSPVRMWETICYNDLIDRKIVFPQRKKRDEHKFEIDAIHGYGIPSEDDHFLEGGHVKEPIPGMYKCIASVDLNSLYPHLIMQFNISPETFRGKRQTPYGIEDYLNELPDEEWEYLVENHLISAGNGCLYDRDNTGFLPRLLQNMYNERVEYKKMMLQAQKDKEQCKDKSLMKEIEDRIDKYKNMQSVIKVSLNSAYGALSNEYFIFYNFDNADSVTSSGRLAIRWIEKKLNEFMNRMMFSKDVDYVIAADTDSIYLNMGPLMEKKYGDLDKIDDMESVINLMDATVKNKIEPYIEDCYRELAKLVNAAKQKMVMKRESLADKGIWTGKKRYILNIWDKEGVRYAEPKIEMKGIEAVRSSTPSSCRTKIKDLMKVIMTKDEAAVHEFIESFRQEFKTLPFDEIAFPRGIKGIKEYSDDAMLCKKGTPVQVRGALVYNKMLTSKNVTNFRPIFDGDKIKFCYLKTPNAVQSYVISVPNIIPKAFNIDDKLDRDLQFEKGFLSPVTKILEAIGWKSETDGNTLESFFD